MTTERRLAAILVADVVGYSKLIGSDEAGTLAQLQALRTEVIEPQIAKHAGRLFKSVGDWFLIEFASAVQAVSCAKAIQDANGLGRLSLRIGIHVGDVVVQGDDLMGDGVNVAARVEGIADPGGIAITRAVHEQVRDKLDPGFIDKGEIELKNIQRPVQVFVIGGPKVDGQATALPLPDKPSIVVLPFQNMSGDPEQEYFADGMVEDIITALSRISAFFVMARNSSFSYKGRAVDVRQVGQGLGVRYVLEGSVRKAGTRLRITGQLVDATTGNHIWAERYEGALEDVFDLQDRITSSVVAIIEPKVQQVEIKRAQAKSTANLTAYDLYLRAFAAHSDYEDDSNNNALALLARAVAIDPRFSTAYGLMANCHVHRLNRGWGSVADAREKGLEAAKRAAETGRDDPRALGWAANGIARFGGNLEEALVHIERALALSPNSVHVRRMSGSTCFVAGQHERSIEHFKRAMQLDPMEPWAFHSYYGIALPYFFTGHYEDALAWVDKALLARPNYASPLRLKIAASAMAGRPSKEIQKAIERLHTVEPELSITELMQRLAHFRQVDFELYAKALRLAGLPE